jgi:hypothetical protein
VNIGLKDDGKILSAADRGGVGIRGERRSDDALLVGKRGGPGTRPVRRMRRPREH